MKRRITGLVLIAIGFAWLIKFALYDPRAFAHDLRTRSISSYNLPMPPQEVNRMAEGSRQALIESHLGRVQSICPVLLIVFGLALARRTNRKEPSQQMHAEATSKSAPSAASEASDA